MRARNIEDIPKARSLPRPYINVTSEFLDQLKQEAKEQGIFITDYLGELIIRGHESARTEAPKN